MTPAPRGWPQSPLRWRRRPGSSSAWAASPGRHSGPCCARQASCCRSAAPVRSRRRGGGPATRSGGSAGLAARLLPPQSAEHLHRTRHPGDARRHLPSRSRVFGSAGSHRRLARFYQRTRPRGRCARRGRANRDVGETTADGLPVYGVVAARTARMRAGCGCWRRAGTGRLSRAGSAVPLGGAPAGAPVLIGSVVSGYP